MPKAKDHGGQCKLIYPAKLSAIIEGKRLFFHNINSVKKDYIQQTKPKENTRSIISGWREKWGQPRDCGKKQKAIIIKTQSIPENTTPGSNNKMTTTHKFQ